MNETTNHAILKRRIILGILVTAVLCGVMLATIMIVPRASLNRLVQGGNDTAALRDRSAEFAAALKQSRVDRIYRLFNASFRSEITPQDLDTAVRAWVANRPVIRIITTHIEIHGLQGLVSTNVYFEEPRIGADGDTESLSFKDEFLFQSWVLTNDGWQLMWLTKIMDPLEMDYGRRDTASMEQLVQLALDTLITGRRIERHLGLSGTPNLVVLLAQNGQNYHVTLPGRTIAWMTRDSIEKMTRKMGISFYIDIQPLRILKDVAIGSLDVIPLTDDPSAPSRRRGEKLLFVRKHGKWSFSNYGAGW
jgi:hypothetical protein